MSKYTTGEVAKKCGVSVRTVQYYDVCEILIPSEFSDGGRRLYSEEDLKKLQLICFLREIGVSIKSIGKIFEEKNSAKVIQCLLKEHENYLKKEVEKTQAKLNMLTEIRRLVDKEGGFSLENINDIANNMESRKKLKKIRINILVTAIVAEAVEITAILLWIFSGLWLPFAVWSGVEVIGAVFLSMYYYKAINYICPECGAIFKPKFKSAFFAPHTLKTRKLTCPNCGKKSYCIETAKEVTVK